MLLLASTWASLHFVSLTTSTPISPVMLCLAMAWDRFNYQWFVGRQGPRSKVPRCIGSRQRNCKKASFISIAAQASFAPFGPRRWHCLFGAKKRCAECTYLRISPLHLRSRFRIASSRIWKRLPFPQDDYCEAHFPAFLSVM